MKSVIDGSRKLVDLNTGEVINVQSIIKQVSGNYFWKVKMMDFLNSIDILGNKSMLVYSFILGHINQRTNRLKMSNKQIRAGIQHEYKIHHKGKCDTRKGHVSLNTVSYAISKLRHITIKQDNKPLLMRKRYGKYGRKSYLMINPCMLMRGSEGKRQGLLIKYDNVDKDKAKSKKRYARRQQHKNQLSHKEHIIRKYKKQISKVRKQAEKLKQQGENINRQDA